MHFVSFGTNRSGQALSFRRMSAPRLSETSYILLGMLELIQPATPYDLKRMAEASTIDFWFVPHTQIYTECARLAREGLLTEEQEQTGRRRRIYSLTEAGRQAMEAWLGEPYGEISEVRDLGVLKLFFGADPAKLASDQLPAHEAQLRSYEEMEAAIANADVPRGPSLVLQAGLGHEREYVRFWKALLDEQAD